jgi:hypothetical protein
MSDNLPMAEEPTSDFTEKDLSQLNAYIDAGLPEIATVDAAKLTRIMEMYLSGNSYRTISNTMGVKKSIILYLSNKFNWYMMRKEYMLDLEQNVRGRLYESKIVGQDFLMKMTSVFQKKIGHKMDRYLATGDESFLEEIDGKMVDRYLKILETLQKISADPRGPASLIGLNVSEGMIIEKKGNGVEITPKTKVVGELLRQFADMRREEEKK